jgi:3-hydroxyisobutyrate dehydrogenase-like beta-hydroxyacid dehydrogenase
METIGVQSPGDMGHALGAVLRERGRRVVSALDGRGGATRARARRAGIEDVGDIAGLAAQCDVVLSVMPPAAAPDFARAFGEALERAPRRLVFVDCNAVSPAAAHDMAAGLAAAGAEFVDGGLIGGPPRPGGPATRLYLSGPRAGALATLGGDSQRGAIDARVVGDAIGRASGLKMVYAGLTKGTMTLHTAVLTTARRLGLFDELVTELRESQAQAFARMGVIPFLPADAGRWTGEMREIARTFRDAGLPGGFHEAAEAIFELMDATPYASETRETLDRSRTLEETIRTLAELATERK